MTRLLVGLAAGASAVGIGAWAWLPSPAVTQRTVEVTIRHSRFSLGTLFVRRGQTVIFVVHNADPIDHEFIVGDQVVQDVHERGTNSLHDGSVPGQISVPAGSDVSTTVRFDSHLISGGTLQYACHLPGHYAYGMHGQIIVRG